MFFKQGVVTKYNTERYYLVLINSIFYIGSCMELNLLRTPIGEKAKQLAIYCTSVGEELKLSIHDKNLVRLGIEPMILDLKSGILATPATQPPDPVNV